MLMSSTDCEGSTLQENTSTLLECLAIAGRHHGKYFSPLQLQRDHSAVIGEPSLTQLTTMAASVGLVLGEAPLTIKTAAVVAKTLPAILPLRNGNAVLLTALDGKGEEMVATLVDPTVGEATPLILEIDRLLAAIEGRVVLVRRDATADEAEAKPFGIAWLAGEILREKRNFRDIVLAAATMCVLALGPAIFWQIIVDRVLAHHSLSTLNVLVGGMVFIIGFDTLFGYLRRSLILYSAARIDARLSVFTFDRLLRLPIDFFERNATGMVARDLNEIWRIRGFLTGQLFGALLDTMVLLVIIPAMFWFSVPLALLVLGLGAAMVAVITGFLPFLRRRTSRAFAAEGQQNAYLVETIQGARTVKSLAVENIRRRAWDRQVADAARLRRSAGRLANAAQTAIAPLEKLMTSGVIAVAAYQALTANDPVYLGTLMAFGILAQRVAQPLVQLAHLVQQFDEASRAVATVAAIVNREPEQGRDMGGVRHKVQGAVSFEAVRFRYPGAAVPALDRLSFQAPSGTVLGIMGRSGSGKTTITRLLQGLHREYEGLIRLDGIDLRAVDLDHLRRNTGVVLQDSFLFTGTIRDNISAATPGASLERVMAAARLAGADEFIERLPMGYETRIEEGSANLSGGQRQRIAIARALISDPPLLILDEATSALDPESEAIVNTNLHRIAKGRTVIVISHRLSSLIGADTILVMDRGQAVDAGSHANLLARCEIYRRLWQQQNRHAVAEPAQPTLFNLQPSLV